MVSPMPSASRAPNATDDLTVPWKAGPASITANTYFGWKWMSAITGIWDFFAIIGSASASSCDGTATRTIWQPVAVSSAICWRVALTSDVSVVVIDWTDTGAPPPTGTLPTMIWREWRRGASGSTGALGITRLTAVTAASTRSYLPNKCTGFPKIAAHGHKLQPPRTT